MPPPQPPPPSRPPLPVGFLLLGMLLVLAGAVAMAGVAVLDDDVSMRAACGMIALLSLVLVEALWFVRPWVARAADAWAAGCVAALLLPTLADVVSGGVGIMGLISAMVVVGLMWAAPVAAVRWYVRDRARKLGFLPRNAPAAPVAIPLPRP
jgi:hypothetical protein